MAGMVVTTHIESITPTRGSSIGPVFWPQKLKASIKMGGKKFNRGSKIRDDEPEKWPEAGWEKMQANFFIVLVGMRPVDSRK